MKVHAPRDRRTTRIVVAAGSTSLLAPIGASFLLVALPDLQHGLSITKVAAGTTVTAYLILMVIAQPLGGRLGDRFGRVRVLRAGMLLLVGASTFGAVASDFQLVLVARLTQALAGSLAFPNAFAVIRNAVPAARRGRILGALGAAVVVSSAAAIPLGQLIVHLGGWRATFLATAALAVPALLLQTWREHDVAPDMSGRDVWLGTAGNRWRGRSGDFVAAIVSLGATNAAMYAFLVAVALGMAGEQRSSLFLFLFLGSSAVGAPLGGRVADQVGRGPSAASGLMAMLLGFAMVARPAATPEWILSMGTLLAGLGVGASMTALQTVAADVSNATRSGRAAGWLASARYLGAAAGSLAGSAFAIQEVGGENAAVVGALIGVLVACTAAAGLVWKGPRRVFATMPEDAIEA